MTSSKNLARSFQAWLETVRAGFADQIFIYIAIVVAGHAYECLRREERERYEYQQALVASELHSLKRCFALAFFSTLSIESSHSWGVRQMPMP
jgi:hypothetical protein